MSLGGHSSADSTSNNLGFLAESVAGKGLPSAKDLLANSLRDLNALEKQIGVAGGLAPLDGSLKSAIKLTEGHLGHFVS